MDVLVVSPPVTTPAEPPSGAFTLASALAGHGLDTALLDLSLQFYHQIFAEPAYLKRTGKSLEYFLNENNGYAPEEHRSQVGVLHRVLKEHSREIGWRLTLMDATPKGGIHDPTGLQGELSKDNPFTPFIRKTLAETIGGHNPSTVVISLAYLSQLAAGMECVRILKELGVTPIVGGSLPRSLARTGSGLASISRHLGDFDLSDGSSLLFGKGESKILHRLAWPRLLVKDSYISCRPVIPLPLSTGCFWRRCLFCPDREMPFRSVPVEALANFFETVPAKIMDKRPIVHLLDSAVPPKLLRELLPVTREHRLGFYGFARPTNQLLEDNLLRDAADSGCLMLQLGVESGSDELLSRFDKGLFSAQSGKVLRTAADVGIRTYLYLLFGLPGETDSHRKKTASFLEAHAGCVDYLNLSLFNLPIHCELAKRTTEFDMELGDYPGDDQVLHLYRPFTCNGNSPREEARRFIEGELMKSPTAKTARLRTPRWFRAAHLAMMNLPGRR